MRRLVAGSFASCALLALTACDTNATDQSARSGPFTPGLATAPTTLFGEQFEPCSNLELEAYPAALAKPSDIYYAGPWCRAVPGGTTYLWSYGRAMTTAQSPISVREDVNRDALTLVSDLRAQNYVVLCGPHEDDPTIGDVAIGMGKPGEKTRIYLTVRGQDLPRSGSQAPSTSATPLSFVITRTESSRVPENPPTAAKC